MEDVPPNHRLVSLVLSIAGHPQARDMDPQAEGGS
jgi:hypothetical protein